jgi:M3 family oligoendopeptidase
MRFSKFEDVKCTKPDLAKIKKQYAKLVLALRNSKDAPSAVKVIEKEFAVSDSVASNYQIAGIRHTINIKDPYYKELNDFYDNAMPFFTQYENEFKREVLSSPFRKDIENAFGANLITKFELDLKCFKEEIIPDLQKENALATQYNDIMGNAKGMYRGQELQITKFDPLMTSPDREVRKDACAGYWGFFSQNESKLADIYDQLVKVRTKIAKALGYANYLPLGYARLGRSDYTPEDSAKYREKIHKYLVPLSESLFARQIKRIGIKDPKYYDYYLKFSSGNPKPVGTPDQLVKDAKKMYKQMSPVASKYFNFMVSHDLMDLVAKDGKIPGGYMTYIPDLKSSYIFSNFNGSSGDVEVLTHEFGHSLQGFLSADIKAPELRSPGYECCEIHSMSMEFFAYPWMKLFFKKDEEKYRFVHLADGINFIPYGVSVDEFQEFAYTHPEATQEERKAAWRAIEKKYLPHKIYGEDNPFLESGGWWMRQLHIYVDPLYYIDYTIAQVGAFEFFVESLTDYQKAFDKYIRYSTLGGTLPFRKLLAASDIANPMDEGTIENLIPALQKYLDSIDDFKF